MRKKVVLMFIPWRIPIRYLAAGEADEHSARHLGGKRSARAKDGLCYTTSRGKFECDLNRPTITQADIFVTLHSRTHLG